MSSLFFTEENDVWMNSIRKIYQTSLVYKIMYIRSHCFVETYPSWLNLRYITHVLQTYKLNANLEEAQCLISDAFYLTVFNVIASTPGTSLRSFSQFQRDILFKNVENLTYLMLTWPYNDCYVIEKIFLYQPIWRRAITELWQHIS